MTPTLLSLLLQKQLISMEDCAAYQRMQEIFPDLSPLAFIQQHNQLSDSQIAQVCAQHYDLAYSNLQEINEPELITQCQYAESGQMIKHHCLPMIIEDQLTIYIADPEQINLNERFRCYSDREIVLAFAPYHALKHKIEQLRSQLNYQKANNSFQNTNIVELVNQIMRDALMRDASDIHIEAHQQHTLIRFRINGLLHPITQLPHHLHDQVLSRLKVLADLKLSERRRPQDGRFTFKTDTQKNQDCRINLCPSLHGEKAVIRLLTKSPQHFTIEGLGFSQRDLERLQPSLQKTQGLILVTGPTGSGKTITLYTLIQQLNHSHKNITTIENPVEIDIDGITQINTSEQIQFGFESALKALLRQDPDIIMIGEIRDKATAKIALKAATTGHLVLASLHTNSCSETLLRLTLMDLPFQQILNATELIIGQRLLRKLCLHCRILDPSTQTYLANEKPGCPHCQYGYQGRIAAFELMAITEPLLLALQNQQLTRHEIEALACQHGMTTMRAQAKTQIENGMTSIAEVQRALGD
jgi:type IV pilus assembly protein PilB